MWQEVQRSPPDPTNNGHSYFMEAGKKDLHTHGLKLWRGKSVCPTMGKMILTVDTSVAAVYIQPLFFSLLLSFSKNGKQILGWGFDECSHGFSQSLYSTWLGLGSPGPKFHETQNIFEQTLGQCSDWTWRWMVTHQDYLGLKPMVGEFKFTNSDNWTMTVAVRTFFSFFSSSLWIFA